MKCTPEEVERIEQKMQEVGIRELVSLLRRCSNNLNQYAKKANETGSIYAEDIADLQKQQTELWEAMKEILARLATIQ